MHDIHDECGVAAVYHLPDTPPSPLCPAGGPAQVTRLLPRMLLDVQNRGQLAAGITSYSPSHPRLLRTHKDVGSVSEVFRLSHPGKCESLMQRYQALAGIGHVRYATCGRDDKEDAQPFERQHLQKNKWFSFAFNGQLANYAELRTELLRDGEHHLSRDTDTELILHEISRLISEHPRSDLAELFVRLNERVDGAYSLVLLNALGQMAVARDPLGIKPLSFASDGMLFAAASESVALANLGFDPATIQAVPPGHVILVDGQGIRVEQFAPTSRTAHCFFEWVYFSNVASVLDGRSVYEARRALGEELAERELADAAVPLDESTIVVPVPDTSKAAADAMAYRLKIPAREGLIRNRYLGRTFIQSPDTRHATAVSKYTPLREVLRDKRVLLVEDSIVRSTTMRVLLHRIREEGGAREIHVRVACPPIIAPCFYGIDMSTVSELFAARYSATGEIDKAAQDRMARELGADSLRYLPPASIARALSLPEDQLCRACITGQYPTPKGQQLYDIALKQVPSSTPAGRTYEFAAAMPHPTH